MRPIYRVFCGKKSIYPLAGQLDSRKKTRQIPLPGFKVGKMSPKWAGQLAKGKLPLGLRPKPLLEGVDRRSTARTSDRGGQRNMLRANRDAVLGVAADLDAAFLHQGIQTFA